MKNGNSNNDMIYEYINNKTILSYNNDLELLIEIIDRMIEILEETEDYEKCLVLKNKKERCLKENKKQYKI